LSTNFGSSCGMTVATVTRCEFLLLDGASGFLSPSSSFFGNLASPPWVAGCLGVPNGFAIIFKRVKSCEYTYKSWLPIVGRVDGLNQSKALNQPRFFNYPSLVPVLQVSSIIIVIHSTLKRILHYHGACQ